MDPNATAPALYIYDSWHGAPHLQLAYNPPLSPVANFPNYGSSDILSEPLDPTATVQNTYTTTIRMPHFESIGFTQVPLTSLTGGEFVKAWLEVVKLHAFLWSRNIKYGDPNLWNAMYDENLKSGVLVDYDISISPVPTTDRTDASPFMAIDLLTDEYWNGEIEREYLHELEAFIWILPFVFLRYQNGESQRGTPIDHWMTSNYITCFKEKAWFRNIITLRKMDKQCQSDFQDHWGLAEWLLFWLSELDQSAYLRMKSGTGKRDDNNVTSIWPAFVAQLRSMAETFSSNLGYIDKLVDDLELESPILRFPPSA